MSLTIPTPFPPAVAAKADPLRDRLRQLQKMADEIYAFLALEQAHERGKMNALQRRAGPEALVAARRAAEQLASRLSDLA